MEQPSLTEHVRTIAIPTHGRYLIDSRDGNVATLVGFHGYQENAAVHLEVLRRIAAGRAINLISIQALNRFYTRAGNVVAGWMTSEDRCIKPRISHLRIAAEQIGCMRYFALCLHIWQVNCTWPRWR